MSDRVLEPGSIVADRYRLESQLGVGGMGVVWRATQLNLGREVALKLLLPEHAAAPESRARFEREARVASALQHPNAVQIYDFGEDDDQLFIAMEVLHGQTLRAIVDEHLPVLPIERVLAILAPVADVLRAAHEMPMVHRDLKPENIFLERTGTGPERVVVVDFGLAFIRHRPDVDRMTREGIAMGTPEYMSPEQTAGEDVGPPTDVYALGCILYEMLTAAVPFRGAAMSILTQQLFMPPVPPSEARRDLTIGRDLEELCLRMLTKLAAGRPTMEVVSGVFSSAARSGPERARAQTGLTGREARMISVVQPSRDGRTLTDPGRTGAGSDLTPLAVVGALEGDLSIGLVANGLLPFIVSDHQPLSGADAVFAPGASPEALAELAKIGLPLVTDSDKGDMNRITALLKAGVQEVVHRPVKTDDLARKVWRAIRKYRKDRKTS